MVPDDNAANRYQNLDHRWRHRYVCGFNGLASRGLNTLKDDPFSGLGISSCSGSAAAKW